MKDLEKALQKYFNSGAVSDLPDVTTDNVLKVNVTPDGYHSIDKGGKVYIIKKNDVDYGIYRAHLCKNKAVLTYKKEPEVVEGFYLDDVPVVLTSDANVFFAERDTRSSYSIIQRVAKYDTRGSFDLLYYVLSAFVAYVYSTYQFSEAYASLVVPPVVYGSFNPTTNSGTDNGSGGTTPATPSNPTTPTNPTSRAADAGTDSTDKSSNNQ